MKRRDLLAQAGTLVAVGSIAGCIGELDSPDESNGDAPGGQPDPGTADGTDTAGTEDDQAETTDGENAGGDGASTEDDVDDGTTDSGDDGGATDSGDDDGTTDSGDEEASGDVGRDDPELASQDISTTDTDCGSTNEATVTFDGGSSTVNVEGSIAASNPCHVATVERASVSDGTLTVVVGVRSDDSDTCQQCLGQVQYDARFGFGDTLPGTVEVQHASQGETTTVTTESRSVQPY